MGQQQGNIEQTGEEKREIPRDIAQFADAKKKQQGCGKDRDGEADEETVAPATGGTEGEQGEKPADNSHHPTLQPPLRQGHPVKFNEAEEGDDQDQTGELERTSLSDQQDEQRQGNDSSQDSFNGAPLSPRPL